MSPTGPAWDELASRLRPFIARRVAGSADVDDVLQEVLLRMYRGLPALEDDDRITAWMFQVARTALADHWRSRARHPPAARDAPEPAAEPEGDDAERVSERLASTLAGFVAMLPPPYRAAITLTELEGKTQREAAALLGLSVSGVKSRVQRGRAQLRRMLEACCEIAIDARGRVVACTPRGAGAAAAG